MGQPSVDAFDEVEVDAETVEEVDAVPIEEAARGRLSGLRGRGNRSSCTGTPKMSIA